MSIACLLYGIHISYPAILMHNGAALQQPMTSGLHGNEFQSVRYSQLSFNDLADNLECTAEILEQ